MNWFESLTGFREEGWSETRERLRVEARELVSSANGRRIGIGVLETPTLAELRGRTKSRPAGRIAVRNVSGDIRAFHLFSELSGALFQVASQFNLLEMIGPSISPEDGVTRYAYDLTQGPACAIAAGGATLYRNYFAPVDGLAGQTSDRQIDTLDGVRGIFSQKLGVPADDLWRNQNGYALPSTEVLTAVGTLIERMGPEERDEIRSALRIGLHWDVEVTEPGARDISVSQAFCSALPIAYGRSPPDVWRPFAELVLEAAYEATVLAALDNLARNGKPTLLLTRLGGGAFGNRDAWIDQAMIRALDLVADQALDVWLVNFEEPPPAMRMIADRYR